ncbi:ABC transporter ATP-binding protein [Saccharothrix australiensis]|nr:ABC transporter ATP-binding protein [Saccharothrix australiensis]
MPFEEGASNVPDSGLTGPATIPDEIGAERKVAFRERVARWRRTAAGTFAALPRVFSLAWQAGPGLTIGLGVASVATGALPAATAYLVKLTLDTVVAAVQIHSAGRPDDVTFDVPFFPDPHLTSMQKIVALVAVQFLLYLGNTALGALRQGCQQLLQERLSQVIQIKVMEHSARLDLSFYEGSESYDLLRQAQEEAPTRPLFMVNGAFSLVQTSVTFASMIVLLAQMNPWLALVAVLAPVPAFISQARYSGRAFVVALWGSPVKRRMHYLSTLVTTDTYAKEVKVFGLGDYFVERFRLLARTWYERVRAVTVRRNAVGAVWTSLTTLTGSLTYLYVAAQAVVGRLTLGDLTLYTQAANSVQTSIQGLFSNFSEMYENNLYLDRMYALLNTPVKIKAPERPVPLPEPLRGHVVFDDVSFTYPGADRPALRNVSFEIRPGQTVAVVGRNGAGKSTLLKLLCRLYEPTGGRVLVDGVDIRDVDPDELRSRMSAVFQDFVTYQATAAENIGLGDIAHLEDRPRIEEAARQAGADAVIERMPRGYDSPLGRWFDQGVNLSGGEWQKVALGRAFLRRASILLLDEPTSALDAEAEHDLFARLRTLASGRTALYISHRFSTVRQADRILLLDDGRLVEEGTHRELMDLDGGYAELFTLQASAYVDEADTGPGSEAGPGVVDARRKG